ncbi:hypothetical protein WJR50_16520 [Catalinimonas sp. 4WD22]|uniref:hypothetical protein n=1 Tax=Catalinimonas locisalis TaxID=3133978 RepID=UPI00310140DC
MNTCFNKLTWILTFVITAGIFQHAFAQSYENETELYQDIWGMEKQEIIKEYLELSEEEGAVFWPVYEAYAEERKTLGKERIDIIMEYAANYSNMTNDKASQLTNMVFKNNMQLEKLQKKYYKKLSKVVTPLRASEFMQLEKYLDSAMRFEIQNNIPFLKELERS